MIAFSPLTFPVWWYTEGLAMAWGHTKARFAYVLRSTGLLIFLRNMGQPLYGDYTRSGRIISFFLRVVLLVIFLNWAAVRLVLVFAGFLLHIAALPLAVIMIIYQLFPS
jgi:hypothetical protein